MSGTPLENRVEEFRNIVSYLQPDLARTASEDSAVQFRRQVAPVYLRRNQEDVLTELPELVEVDEWLGMSAADNAGYRAAVSDGNFAAMRRAAMLSHDSEKLTRLREIVEEAEGNGRRVIVYSYFLDVLELISATLPGQVFRPLTGTVPAPKRQQMVDEFSTAQRGAALVSQIVAGGVGLNIEAASVVVICEPQLKPTTESQAIARAHRIGQVHSVQVHRLLSEGCVDERVRQILARKRATFYEVARISETADATPEAVDISEARSRGMLLPLNASPSSAQSAPRLPGQALRPLGSVRRIRRGADTTKLALGAWNVATRRTHQTTTATAREPLAGRTRGSPSPGSAGSPAPCDWFTTTAISDSNTRRIGTATVGSGDGQ
jgi:hypothetical protein